MASPTPRAADCVSPAAGGLQPWHPEISTVVPAVGLDNPIIRELLGSVGVIPKKSACRHRGKTNQQLQRALEHLLTLRKKQHFGGNTFRQRKPRRHLLVTFMQQFSTLRSTLESSGEILQMLILKIRILGVRFQAWISLQRPNDFNVQATAIVEGAWR